MESDGTGTSSATLRVHGIAPGSGDYRAADIETSPFPGLPTDTFVAYGGPNFKRDRKRLQAKILKTLLKTCHHNAAPQAILMMGGPASGKSSALKGFDTSGFTTLPACTS